jgi:predicted O-methyltransferase YrrM
MKMLPEVTVGMDPLKQMLYGAIPAKLLLTAIELDVFSHLDRPGPADVVAERLGTHPRNTRLLLDALAANDLVCKRHERYWNTPLAEAYLTKGQPTYLGDVLLDSAEWMRPALESLPTLVRQGPPPSGRAPHSIPWPKEAEIRANYQRAGFAQFSAAMVGQLPEFSGMETMLDLGSGAGLIGLAIVASHPTMTGVLFDRPEVVEVAERFVREYELDNRVTTIGGDYNNDAIGGGYDLIWTSYTLRPGDLGPVLRKIHAALKDGGVYINVAEGLSHERTRPTMLINAMLAVNLTSQHVMLEEGELAQAMLRAGFRSVHTRALPGPQPHGSAMVDIARR